MSDETLERRCELTDACPHYRGMNEQQRNYCPMVELQLQCDYYIETMQGLGRPIEIPISLIDKVFIVEEDEPLYTFDENDYLVRVYPEDE